MRIRNERYVLTLAAGLALTAGLWGQTPPTGPSTLVNGAESQQSAPLFSGVVLQVNDDALTSADVLGQMKAELETLVGPVKRKEDGKLDLDDFVGRVLIPIRDETMGRVYNLLIYQFARNDLDKVEGVDKAIETMRAERRKDIISRHGGSETRARQELAALGSTIDKELEKTEKELVIGGYRDKHFTPTIKVTRSQMLQYYRANLKEKFSRDALIEFELIDIQKSRHDDPQAVANKALEELGQGVSFAEVAGKYSDGLYRDSGGKWRPVDPNSVRDTYQPAIDVLRVTAPGQITPVIETGPSLFIGRSIANTPARVVPFSEVQNDIFLAIRDARWDRYSGELSQKLMETAVLGDMEGFIKSTVILAYDEFNRSKPAVSDSSK